MAQVYFPTRHQLSWELPATASRSQLSPREGKPGHTRDHSVHSCFPGSIPGHMWQRNHREQQQLNYLGREQQVSAAHSSSQRHKDGCHTADHVYRGVATCQRLYLHLPTTQPQRRPLTQFKKTCQNQLSRQSHSPGAGVTVFRC